MKTKRPKLDYFLCACILIALAWALTACGKREEPRYEGAPRKEASIYDRGESRPRAIGEGVSDPDYMKAEIDRCIKRDSGKDSCIDGVFDDAKAEVKMARENIERAINQGRK